MEIAPGVFVSNVSTDEWEFDPEVNGDLHLLCTDVGIEAGMSRFTGEISAPVSYTPPSRETLLVLEGAATIRIADGPTLELAVGDMASLPAGRKTTWELTTPFKEFWVLA
jgi:quercetin dioxygenase-like cupin family protein